MFKSIKSLLLVLICVTGVSFSLSSQVFAENKSETQLKTEVYSFLTAFKTACNKKDINAVTSFYSSDYISGDNFSRDEMLKNVQESWDYYTNLLYSQDVKDVRVTDNWAAVETYNLTTGNTIKKSVITEDFGDLKVDSHQVIYLRRIGKDWKIVNDLTYYEKIFVNYGMAKSMEIGFDSPEQVSAGQMYSAKISMEVPVGTFAVGSITKEPVAVVDSKLKELFRGISLTRGNLERVFEANESNNNAVVTAAIGITELTEDNQARPIIKIKGLSVISNRINVVPHSSFDIESYKSTNKESIRETLDIEQE